MTIRRRIDVRAAHRGSRQTMCAWAVVMSVCSGVPRLSAQIVTTVKIDSSQSAGADTSATRVTVAIQHPNVGAPSQTFPQIVLRPGDRWLLSADGCVQTGGRGQTWKRYVNPVGPGTERLYRAWVRVLDGTAPAPIESIVGREQIIPAAADPQSLHFTLGYVDDDYADNSYERHDDGIDQQCAGQEGARLSLTIIRARRASLVARASRVAVSGRLVPPTAQLVAHAVSEAATTAVWPGGGSLNALRIGAYRRVDESPGAASSGFDLFVLADQTGMQWDAERHAYVGTLWFSVLEHADNSAPFTDLPTEIPVQLSADGATVEPKDPIVKQTRRRLAVTVSTRRFVDKVRVHIVPLGLLRPTDIDFAVRQERLVLTLDDTIERFALGHTDVTVALPQGAPHDSVAVRLTKVDGSVAPPTVWVTATRPAFAKFWSGGGRRGQIIATAMGPYEVTRRDVVYVWPMGFLIATLLGALAGGTATLVFRKRSWTRKGAILLFVGALVTGTLAAIAGAVLGVKIGTFDPAAGGGLALVFVLSLLGAWAGPRLLRVFGDSLG